LKGLLLLARDRHDKISMRIDDYIEVKDLRLNGPSSLKVETSVLLKLFQTYKLYERQELQWPLALSLGCGLLVGIAEPPDLAAYVSRSIKVRLKLSFVLA
jgi:hypothetical protein